MKVVTLNNYSLALSFAIHAIIDLIYCDALLFMVSFDCCQISRGNEPQATSYGRSRVTN